jgi:hypothetical protein
MLSDVRNIPRQSDHCRGLLRITVHSASLRMSVRPHASHTRTPGGGPSALTACGSIGPLCGPIIRAVLQAPDAALARPLAHPPVPLRRLAGRSRSSSTAVRPVRRAVAVRSIAQRGRSSSPCRGGVDQKLVAPAIELTRADPVFARDPRNRDIRRRALRHDRLLLLCRPAPATLAACDHLDALRASTLMSTYMSAPISRLGCLCAVDVGHHGGTWQQTPSRYRNVGTALRLRAS